MENEVIAENRDGVLIVTLNRPKARNAVNRAMAEQLAAAMDTLDSDSSLRVGILTGAGGSFCSGMDLKAFVSGEVPYVKDRGFAGLVEAPPAKPLIAAVEGYALAGGCELAISCDLIVAASDARFGIPEVKRGLAAAAGGLLRLPQQLPYRVAMELALTGDFIDAGRALELGLINRLADSGAALSAAIELAQRIVANGPLAVQRSKQVLQESLSWPQEEQFARQREVLDPVFKSKDAIEGAKAFAEKRTPEWRGE